MNIKEKNFIVAGLGKSGIGAANLLEQCNAEYVLFDENKDADISRMKDNLINKEAKIVLGDMDANLTDWADIMVISPGIPVDAPFVNKVRKEGVTIWGEVELAYVCAKGKLAAITGTNGKTTTTALVGEILGNYFESAFVVGNIGIPYTSVALDMKEESVTVAEISSFQLETVDTFHPAVSAVLNITPDHLNRHYTMENYANVKMSIAKNQTADEVCVLNYEDEYIKSMAEKIPARIVWFSSKEKLDGGIYLENEEIIWNVDGTNTSLMNIHDMKLVGIHNVENVMAAIGIAYFMGVPMDVIIRTVKQFRAVAHRIEYVTTKNGVVFYNDSKGTNTDASTKAIEAMPKKTILIAGGYDKGVSFDEWVDSFGDKVKALVLLGNTKNKIKEAAEKKGFTNIHIVESLKDAVDVSYELAAEGEVVLLSPACASWDMFKSYEQRGDLFKEYVNQL